ncbi:MAG: hypothetical protein RLY49_435 [Candidatus Parcubacteria bacterium]|jgi:hypothetical protein
MKNTIIAIASLLAALFIIVYGYELIFNRPVIEAPEINTQADIKEVKELKEQHKDSKYIFAGTVDVPTPCHSLKTVVNQLSPTKYQIQVDTVAPKADVMCAQVISQKQYKAAFQAPDNIIVTVKINGVEYETNRFVIPNTENIDTFKLEIKG